MYVHWCWNRRKLCNIQKCWACRKSVRVVISAGKGMCTSAAIGVSVCVQDFNFDLAAIRSLFRPTFFSSHIQPSSCVGGFRPKGQVVRPVRNLPIVMILSWVKVDNEPLAFLTKLDTLLSVLKEEQDNQPPTPDQVPFFQFYEPIKNLSTCFFEQGFRISSEFFAILSQKSHF